MLPSKMNFLQENQDNFNFQNSKSFNMNLNLSVSQIQLIETFLIYNLANLEN